MSFKPILDVSDADPFKGRIVAYKTQSTYLGGNRGVQLKDDGLLRYAYIAPNSRLSALGEEVFDLNQLIKPDEVQLTHAIGESSLNMGVSMRLASLREIVKIKKAIKAKEAVFEQMPDIEKVKQAIQLHLTMLKAFSA